MVTYIQDMFYMCCCKECKSWERRTSCSQGGI